eukprot:m.750669 g.750669  ORF g.750669 m.750669 type:complete len:129 (+) comp23162_c0_seq9:1883-2269(+)
MSWSIENPGFFISSTSICTASSCESSFNSFVLIDMVEDAKVLLHDRSESIGCGENAQESVGIRHHAITNPCGSCPELSILQFRSDVHRAFCESLQGKVFAVLDRNILVEIRRQSATRCIPPNSVLRML